LSLQSDLGETAVMTHRPHGLTVDRTHFSGAPGVLLRGAMDLATASGLAPTLDVAIRESRGAFVIDLCETTFLDSSGVSVLLRARALLGREERSLVIVCPPGPARRIFELAGVDDLLELLETRDQVAASLQPAT
jgi:anti-sigma B factor antagonist